MRMAQEMKQMLWEASIETDVLITENTPETVRTPQKGRKLPDIPIGTTRTGTDESNGIWNHADALSIFTHKTRLVQWTWNVLSIQDYPGASDECNPRSSHPSYETQPRQRRIPKEMTILEWVMTAWHLADITPPRTSQEAEEMKEKQKRKAQIMFLAPSVKFRCPMLAFQLFEYLVHFWSYSACLVPTKIDSVPTEIFIPQSRRSFR